MLSLMFWGLENSDCRAYGPRQMSKVLQCSSGTQRPSLQMRWMWHYSSRQSEIFTLVSGVSIWMFAHCFISDGFSCACTAKIRTGRTGEVASSSYPSRTTGRDQSANREVSDKTGARRQSDSGDAEGSTTSLGVTVHLPEGSRDSTSESQNEEPAAKSASGAKNFTAVDELRPRAQEPSTPLELPAAKEAELQRVPHRNHCRPVLNGAPFIICSSCFKLVQMPAELAVSSTNTVRKLRCACGSCSAVLSCSYRDPARKKPYKDSTDQLSTDTSEPPVDAALPLLEVLEEPRVPSRGNFWFHSSTSGVIDRVRVVNPIRVILI